MRAFIGDKNTSKARVILKRVRHLLEDKADLYKYARSEPGLGPRGGKVNWNGYIDIAKETLDNLKYDIEAYDSKGCGNSHKKLSTSARGAAQIQIPNKSSR